jgi:RNA polymerase sigma-B factor
LGAPNAGYARNGALPDPERREVHRLFVLHREEGDRGAREQLVSRFLPLARQLARRYAKSNESLEDLVQVASVGLVKAVDRFDHARGTPFASYAVPTIMGELKRHFRDASLAVHVPRGIQDRAMRVGEAVSSLSRELNRSPTPAEVSELTGIPTELVLEATEASIAYETVSLDSPRAPEGGDGVDDFAETLGAEDERYELVEYGATLAATLRALPPRDRAILRLRFVEDLTQSEIAARVGVSQMHVSRLIRRALRRLQAVAGAA